MIIKSYKDGDRYVVIFEGNDVKETEIDRYLAGLSEVEKVSDANLEPLDEPTYIVIENGKYQGLTPCDIFHSITNGKEEMEVFKEMNLVLKDANSLLSECILSEITHYLRKKFKNTNAEEYENNLSEKQKKLFIEIYGSVIPDANIPIKEIIKYFKEERHV